MTFEAPFLYLLFGNERALLLDTGATRDPARFPLRDTVDSLVQEWTSRWLPGRPGRYGLVVAHTHAHGDHVAGDAQLAAGRAPWWSATTCRRSGVLRVRRLAAGPGATSTWAAGSLDVLAIPGHHPAHDRPLDRVDRAAAHRRLRLPGRLYVRDARAFAASLDRLAALVEERGRCGTSWAATSRCPARPGADYPIGADYQPDEAPLAMTVDRLKLAVARAARDTAGQPGGPRVRRRHPLQRSLQDRGGPARPSPVVAHRAHRAAPTPALRGAIATSPQDGSGLTGRAMVSGRRCCPARRSGSGRVHRGR